MYEHVEINLRFQTSVFLGNQQESAAEAQVDPMAHATDTVPSSKCMRTTMDCCMSKNTTPQNTTKYIKLSRQETPNSVGGQKDTAR